MKRGPTIWIPADPHYRDIDWVAGEVAHRNQMLAWCKDHGYRELQHYVYDFVSCLYQELPGHSFSFDNRKHAMLFKLAWGGIVADV